MKVWENIVAAFLVVVLDESESEREGRGEEPTVLRDSRILVEELEKINERWEEEYRKNEKQGEEIMIASWDIAAMYPSLKLEYVVREVDTLLVERIGQKPQGAKRDAAKRLRKVIMPLLIIMLQHQFVYVRDEGMGEAEKKIFYWQKEGIGIGSSASGPIADITVLVGERIMLEKLQGEGFKVKMYKRYIDDIFAMVEGGVGKSLEAEKRIERGLNELDTAGSVRVEGKAVVISRHEKIGEDEKRLEFLDVDTVLGWGHVGASMSTEIYRKEAAADLYIQASSAHPESLKIGMIKGEVIRYISLCSQKTGFDKAWNRFAKALKGRGYTARQLKKASEDLDYTSRPSLIKKRKDKATDNSTEQKECPGVPIVVPHKPGVAQWWQDCKERDLTIGLRGLQQAEIAYLPGKGMLKCLSGTDNLGKLLKKG